MLQSWQEIRWFPYKVEKNCCDNFSQISLSPVAFLSSSSDSLQELFFEIGKDDCSTMKIPAATSIVKNNDMVCFNLMLVGFPSFDDNSRFNVTTKVKM